MAELINKLTIKTKKDTKYLFITKKGKIKQKVSATWPLGNEFALESSLRLAIYLIRLTYSISFLYSSLRYNLGDMAGTKLFKKNICI